MTMGRPLGTSLEHVRSRVTVGWARAKRAGLLRTAVVWLLSTALSIILSPLALALHLAGFRRLTFVTTRIGHLAAEPDCFLKARALGELPGRRWFFIAPIEWVANEHLLSYWTPHIPVVRNPIASRLIAAMTAWGLMSYDTGRYVMWYDHSEDLYRLNAAWAARGPLLSLTPEDDAWGEDMLRRLELPADAWYVCVHAREGGFSPDDEVIQRYRNSDPASLVAAVTEIVARGGWCIRMGDPSMRPLPQADRVIDYAHHSLRSARLDVVLCAKAKCFLGNSSGLSFVSSIFGRPNIRVNAAPLSAPAPWPTDISIPKLYWSRQEQRYLRFDEILGTPAASFRFANQFERAGIELCENSAEEIRDATLEMLDSLDGQASRDPEIEVLEQRFKSLLRPGDYGYGMASRLSGRFLLKYRDLLPG